MAANDSQYGCATSPTSSEEGSTQFVRAMLETSLDIHRGELLCLMGRRLRQVRCSTSSAAADTDDGQVLVGDTEVRGPLPQEIAYVFQENALFPWSSVIENVNLGMMFRACRSRARAAGAQVACGVGLSDFANHYPGQLSAACASARRSRARSAWRPALS